MIVVIPHHTLVALYYDIPSGVCPSVCLPLRLSVRPSAPFTIDKLSICSWIFFKFAYILLSGMSGMGLVMGKICPFLYARLKNGRIMLYPSASVRPSVNFSFPCNSSYSLRPIELKLGI